jgi:transposase-like protein
VLLCADADAAAADLASGALACPSCGIGRLRAWGYGRERVIRALGGERRRLRPRRGRCRSCGATHILLPAWSAPRRADAVGVIARAAAASVLHGTGTARLGAELGVPAATVRGWLRRLRERAGQMLQEATAEFGRLVAVIETPEGRDPSPPGPTGSRLGDALALVAACAVAAVRWHGRAEADLEALAGRFGLAAALTPAPGN